MRWGAPAKAAGIGAVALVGLFAGLQAGPARSDGSTPVLSADPSFNNGNPVLLSFPPPAGASAPGFVGGAAVARQPDGKVVVAGYDIATVGGNQEADFDVARVNANGTIDTSFGTNGYVSVSPTAGAYNLVSGIAIQNDGSIVLAGSDQPPAAVSKIALVRLTSSGALDTTFGTGGVVVDSSDRGANDLALDASGNLVVPTATGKVRRYTSSGVADATFGTAGSTASVMDAANALVLQPDGKIVIAGSKQVSGASHGIVARFNADGSADTSFGSSGVTDISTSGNEFLDAVTLEGTSILAGGNLNEGNGDLLVKLTSAGVLDPTFGTGGRVADTTGAAVNALLYIPQPQIGSGGGVASGTTTVASVCQRDPNTGAKISCTASGDAAGDGSVGGMTETCGAGECTVDVAGAGPSGSAYVEQKTATDTPTTSSSTTTTTPSTTTTPTTQSSTTTPTTTAGTTTTTTPPPATTTAPTTTSDPCASSVPPDFCKYDLAVSDEVEPFSAKRAPFRVTYTFTITNNGPKLSPESTFKLLAELDVRSYAGSSDTSLEPVENPKGCRFPDELVCDVQALVPKESVTYVVTYRVTAARRSAAMKLLKEGVAERRAKGESTFGQGAYLRAYGEVAVGKRCRLQDEVQCRNNERIPFEDLEF